MVVVAPPNPESRDIAKWFTDHEKRIKRVETGLRTAQLGNSALNGSGLDMFDQNGNYRGTIGFQADGTTTVTSANPEPPPVPGAPSVTGGLAHLLVKHTGETASGVNLPADLSHFNVYTADAGLPEVRTLRGTINPVPGELVVTGLDYATYLVTVTSVNLGGKESAHSATASGAPSQAVSADLINGIVQEIHLNDNIVSAATLKANAVTATKISDDAIETRHLTVGSVDAAALAVGSVNAGKIVAGAITTDKLAALAITADKMAVNSITASSIVAGAITAAKLEANMVLATRIIAGTLTGARVEIHPTNGLQAYMSNGTTRTFWINAATGEAYFSGEIETALTGSRIVINPNGTAPDSMRLYQGSVYGQIIADPAPGNTAAVLIEGSGTNRGRLGVYPGEGFVSWVDSGGNSRSAASCLTDTLNLWGGNVIIEARDQWGGGVTELRYRNTSGTLINSRTLQHKGAGSGEPALYSPFYDTQLVWLSGGMAAQSGDGVTAKPFSQPSSESIKKNRRAPIFGNLTAYDLVKNIPSDSWSYIGEWNGEGPAPARRKWKERVEKRDDKGKILVGEYDEVEVLGAEPIPMPIRVGPMAEDIERLAPQLIVRDLGLAGGKGYDPATITGVLWAALNTAIARIETLEAKVK